MEKIILNTNSETNDLTHDVKHNQIDLGNVGFPSISATLNNSKETEEDLIGTAERGAPLKYDSKLGVKQNNVQAEPIIIQEDT